MLYHGYFARGTLCLLTFFLGFTVVHQQADGQVTASAYNGPGDFAYDVHSMPDLDQKRNGLPNDGSMYCIPTSCMNLCAFAANFGFPGLGPGPGFWQGPANHDLMTTYIGFMGQYMGTTADGGTGGTGKINGMNNWISDFQQPMCIVTAYPDDDGYWPTIDRAAIHATSGAVVQMSYGRYEWQQVANRPYLTDRTGGHGVTLKLAFANNGSELGDRLIHYRNPGSDEGDLNSNSVFSSDWPDTAANIVIGTGIYGTSLDYVVTSLINPPPSGDDNRYRIMDSYLALYPGGGLSFDGVQVNAIFVNGSLGFVQNQQPVPFDIGPIHAQSLVSVIPHPENHSSLALVSVPGWTLLYQASHAGRYNQLLRLPEDTRCLALGFGHEVFAVTDSELKVFICPSDRAEIRTTIPLPFDSNSQTDAMAYDDQTERVIIVAGTKIVMVDPKTGQSSIVRRIAGVGSDPHPVRSIVIHNGQLIAALANGRVATASFKNQTDFITEFKFNQIVLDGVQDALAVDVDSSNRLYVSDAREGLLEYVPDQRSIGGWTRSADPLYRNFNLVGRRFVAFKNRTNIRPGDLRESQWYNVDPSELVPLGPSFPDE